VARTVKNALMSRTLLLSSAFLVLAASVTVAQTARPAGTDTAVFAGGCFWGVDAVFRHVRGVVHVTSGYAGGGPATAHYPIVSTGMTGHAESVEVTYDPAQISYGQLLLVFFTVAHDPTQLNRQGPDVGTQYRSAIFFSTKEQQRAADDYIGRLTREGTFDRPIVTQVVPLKGFYAAEAYHQDYLAHHLDQPYIVYNDLPKLRNLERRFPALYRP
jgi:peptide-methionine (S)-S-oxide reductase